MNPLKRLQNLLKGNPDQPKEQAADLEQIYRDKAGNIYYKHRDDRQMSAHRLRIAEIACIEAELCLNSKDGSMLVDKVITGIEMWAKSPTSTGLSESLAILVELERRFKALAEEETFLKLATVYFMMNDEDPETYSSIDQQKKKDAWEVDKDAKDFFLCRAAEVTRFFGTTSDKDILLYLKKHQPDLKKTARYLEKSGLGNT